MIAWEPGIHPFRQFIAFFQLCASSKPRDQISCLGAQAKYSVGHDALELVKGGDILSGNTALSRHLEGLLNLQLHCGNQHARLHLSRSCVPAARFFSAEP
jgi:hypothetical protein